MSAPLSSPFWAPPPAQPQPAQPKRKRSVLLTVCPFILANEFCERLAFYGVYTNMIVYLQSYMDMTMADAAFQLSMFEGTCYVTPLLGAYLADSFWGRYTTILVFSTVYMVGMLLLAASASVPGLKPLLGGSPTPLQVSMLFLSLYIVAVGTGGIKPTVSAFGADQFDERDPQDRREKKSFFNWFYFVINIGSLLAVTVVVQIQEKISWGLGFAIPAVAMLLAILCFVSGSGLYRHAKIGKSPLQRVVGVCWTAMRQSQRDTARARQPRPPAAPLPPGRGNGVLTQPLLQSAYPTPAESAAPNIAGPNQRQLTASASFRWLERAIENVQVEETTSAMEVAGRLKGYTPRQVEEVKMVLRLLPVFFATIMYWTLYNQMGTLFVSQGMLMNRDITLPGGKVFTIASANLAVFDTLSIILLIPVYDQMLVPALKRCGVHITQLQRCGWGMVLSVVAMVVAGAVESFRLSRHEQGLPPPHIVWQVPQYLLVGGSEVLASIAQLEFFYDQAPDVMRSCAMALQLLSTAMGNYLSGAVLQLVQGITSRHGNPGWLPKDLNQGHADFFLYLLAGMMMVNIVAFSIVAMRYVYKDVDHWESMPRLPSVLEWSRRAEPWARPQAVQGIQEQRPAATAIAISGRQTPEMVADVGPYGRSVTYQPSSPALPFNFR